MIKFETEEELDYLRKVVDKAIAYMMVVAALEDNPVEDFTLEEDDGFDGDELKLEVIMKLSNLKSKCCYEMCVLRNERKDKATKE